MKDFRHCHVSLHEAVKNFHRFHLDVKVTRGATGFRLIQLTTALVEPNHFSPIERTRRLFDEFATMIE